MPKAITTNWLPSWKGKLDKVDMIQNNPDEAARIAAEAASAQGSEVAPEVFKTIFERVDFSLDVDDEVMWQH